MIIMSLKGVIYLIQPCELIGTNRFKIGCSKDTSLNRVQNGYKKGTRYLYISECNNPLLLEKKIIDVFNEKFKLIAGREYFEGNEEEINKCFIDIVKNYKDLNNNEDLNKNELQFLRDYIEKTKEKAKNASMNYYKCKYTIKESMTEEEKETVKNNILKRNERQKKYYNKNKETIKSKQLKYRNKKRAENEEKEKKFKELEIFKQQIEQQNK